jgi:hypothetical protein
MMEPSDTAYTIKTEGWKVKEKEYSRGRMKIFAKLNKDEAQAFTNFKKAIKPDGQSEEDFIRAIFMAGMEAIDRQMMIATINGLETDENLRAQIEKDGGNPDQMAAELRRTHGMEEKVVEEEVSENVEIVEDEPSNS